MADTAVLQINMRELRDLYGAVRKARPDIAVEIRGALRKGGEAVKVAAGRRISPFSTRIPESLKVRTNGFNVSVIAGGDGAPHAAPFENEGSAGQFRHPVFGNRRNWVSQMAHPFLLPAFEAKQDLLLREVMHAVDVVFDKL